MITVHIFLPHPSPTQQKCVILTKKLTLLLSWGKGVYSSFCFLLEKKKIEVLRPNVFCQNKIKNKGGPGRVRWLGVVLQHLQKVIVRILNILKYVTLFRGVKIFTAFESAAKEKAEIVFLLFVSV